MGSDFFDLVYIDELNDAHDTFQTMPRKPLGELQLAWD